MKFLLTIEPPKDDPRFCPCPRCHSYNKGFLEILAACQVQKWLDEKDPFGVFPNRFAVNAVWHPDQLEADHWRRLIFALREVRQWLEETHALPQFNDDGAKIMVQKIKQALSFL